jgi:hypothetical protein
MLALQNEALSLSLIPAKKNVIIYNYYNILYIVPNNAAEH